MRRFVTGVDRSQMTLLPGCLDDRVDEDNPVHVIEAFVEALDLPSLGFAGATAKVTGRPSYHPAVFLKLCIYGYLNRVQSSRRLERDVAMLYAGIGRPSIAPEKLLRAMLLQAIYSVRSERQLMERLEFDLLFRWFVGVGVDEPVWDHSTFSKNRDRLLEGAGTLLICGAGELFPGIYSSGQNRPFRATALL